MGMTTTMLHRPRQARPESGNGAWPMKPCKELCIKIQDGTHFSPRLGGDDFLYVTSKSIRFGYLDLSTAERISAAEHRKIFARCDTRRGDLLLTKDGANTGNAALNCIDEEISLLSSVAFLRFDPVQHDARFFLQYILSHRGQQRLQELMSGNAITRLTLQKIRNFDMPAPSVDEQRAVAAALSDVDGLIASLDRLIAKKRAIKQAAMQQLLTGKTRLPGMSRPWIKQRVADVIERFFCGPSPECEERNIADESEWGVLKTTCATLENGWDWTAHKVLPRAYWGSCDIEVRRGDVIVTKAGPRHRVGISAWVDRIPQHIVVSGKMIALRPRVDRAVPLMLASAIAARDTQQYLDQRTTGMAESQVNFENAVLIQAPIVMPEFDEQQAIAVVIDDLSQAVVRLERRRNKATAIKQGIMQALLTGRVRLPVEAAAGGKA